MILYVASILVSFGTYGVVGNNVNQYKDCVISVTATGNFGLSTTGDYKPAEVKLNATFNCDFTEYVGEGENLANEYFVTFKDGGASFSAYNYSTNDYVIENSTYNFNTYITESNLEYSGNSFTLEASVNNRTSLNSDVAYLFSYYDNYTDDSASVYGNFATALYSTGFTTGVYHTFVANVPIDYITDQVKGQFNLARGGYATGYATGYADGNANGYDTGYSEGYSEGYTSGVETNGTAFTIFNGILNIGMIPINFFLAMFNFNILGINISNFVMSLISVLITIYIFRLVTGKKES